MTGGINGSANSRFHTNDQKLDHSVLRSSIDVSITGMKQALLAIENGNKEIRDYLFHECNIIYECKVCFNMFRSLANFVMHKRSYCEKRYCEVIHQSKPGDDDYLYQETEDVVQHTFKKVQHPCVKPLQTTVFVIPEEPIETVFEQDDWDINDYAPSLTLLQEAGILEEFEGMPLLDNFAATQKRKRAHIDSIAAKLKAKAEGPFDESYYKSKLIRLEKMCQTNNAVFQTISTNEGSPTMGQQYVDLQKAQKLGTSLLGPDGKTIHRFNHHEKSNFPLSHGKCKDNLEKSITKGKESVSSTYTTSETRKICPRCMKEFSSLSNTYRHLINVHGFSKVGAVRMKKKIIQKQLSKKSKSTVDMKPSNGKTDGMSFFRGRTSSDVSIAHFSKMDQIRAEECLKNQPKVKIQENSFQNITEKAVAKPGRQTFNSVNDSIVENLNSAVCNMLNNHNRTQKQNNVLQNKSKDTAVVERAEKDNYMAANQQLYINNLYVQVNNFDTEEQDKEETEDEVSASNNVSKSSDKYMSPRDRASNLNDVMIQRDSHTMSSANSSVLLPSEENYGKQILEGISDSDYESYSPSSRTSRSSRTSNIMMSSNETKSSRSSSKENVLGQDDITNETNWKTESPSGGRNSLSKSCLPNQTKSKSPTIIDGNLECDNIIELSERKKKEADLPANAQRARKSVSSSNTSSEFRRHSRITRRALEASNTINVIPLPSRPLEYNARGSKAQTEISSNELDVAKNATSPNRPNSPKKSKKSPLKETSPAVFPNDKLNAIRVKNAGQTSLNTVTSNKHDMNGREKFMRTVPSWSKQNNLRTSPRYSHYEQISEGLKQPDHSMLGTIMARREINSRSISNHNFFSLPKKKFLRSVTVKSQNLHGPLSLTVLGSNQTTSTSLSMPPLIKKRKLT